MNQGVLAGFTSRRSSQAAPGYPQLRIVKILATDSDEVLIADNVGVLLLVEASAPRTLPLRTVGVGDGAQIHIVQWSASQITIAETGGPTLRTPSTKKTKAQYSTVTLTKISGLTDEWLLSGDLE